MRIHTLSHRNEFGTWLTQNDLLGVGVEVGTFRGEYAEQLAKTWAGRKLHTCDPWAHYPEYLDGCVLDHSVLPRKPLDLEAVKAEAEGRLRQFGDKVEIHRVKGERLLMEFGPSSLSFVYLDGNHSYETVLRELRLAWTRVVPGGIVASHDAYNRHDDLQICGVLNASIEFGKEFGLEPYTTGCSSVWFEKE